MSDEFEAFKAKKLQNPAIREAYEESRAARDIELETLAEVSAPVITLCGSTRFKAEFAEANQRLSMAGNVVISLGVFGHTDLPDYDWSTDATDLKSTLDRLHFQKIRMADEVYVIDVGGYIGESTAREIDYAQSLGKPVRYLSVENTRAELIAPLIAQRKAMGLTQAQVAERMDVTQSTVSEFESTAADSRLSTMRRYALAVHAHIQHKVVPIGPPKDEQTRIADGDDEPPALEAS